MAIKLDIREGVRSDKLAVSHLHSGELWLPLMLDQVDHGLYGVTFFGFIGH